MSDDKDTTQAEYMMLERMFSHEIDCALRNSRLPICFQSKSKIMKTLESQGLIEHVEFKVGTRFAAAVEGWALTELGRFTYCMSCDDEPKQIEEAEDNQAIIDAERRRRLEAIGQQRLIDAFE